ncbi:MAG TPA: YggT family protein [Anaerolineae bacterium]|jgi:YggT family protein|nr:YggT family protein [Anaerolineae bacterium]HAE60311.1 YggT family protein [Anaerolineae bacterium]
MVDVLISAIRIIEQLFTLLVIVKVIISYFVSPYNSFRMTVDRLVEPFLAPIRRILPTIGMFDFSPLVLIILVQLIAGILVNILWNVR